MKLNPRILDLNQPQAQEPLEPTPPYLEIRRIPLSHDPHRRTACPSTWNPSPSRHNGRGAAITSNLQFTQAPDSTGQAVSIVCDAEGLYIIASDKGEVLEQQVTKVLTKQPYINLVSKYVGIDTRFPTLARDAAELLEGAEVHAPFIGQLKADYRNIWSF